MAYPPGGGTQLPLYGLVLEESGEALDCEEEHGAHTNQRFKVRKVAFVVTAMVSTCGLCLWLVNALYSAAPSGSIVSSNSLTRDEFAVLGLESETDATPSPDANNTAVLAGKLTECSELNARLGSMTDIATPSNKTFSEEWPQVNSEAYSVISKCITMLPLCDPSSVEGFDNVRDTYPSIIGTTAVDMNYDRLSNDALMMQLYENYFKHGSTGTTMSVSTFQVTRQLLRTEVEMLQAVGGWFDIYTQYYVAMEGQMQEAFTSALSLIDMEATTTVDLSKHSPWHMALKLINMVGTTLTMGSFFADGALFFASKETKKVVKSVSAVGSAMTKIPTYIGNIKSGTKNIAEWFKGDSATYSEENSADNLGSVAFYDVINILQSNIRKVVAELGVQEGTIATNYGRLSAASSIATICGLTSESIELQVEQAWPEMQWYAFGLLFNTKYAIYWQRDYGQGSSYYKCYAAANSKQQWKTSEPTVNPGDSCYLYTKGGTVAEAVGPSVDFASPLSGCNNAHRRVWIAEKKSPDTLAPTGMSNALAGPHGPIKAFVNKRFHTNFTEGFQPFAEKCKYMSHLYILPSSSYNAQGSVDASQLMTTPSSVSLPCDVYGIVVETYAFPDCNYVQTLNDDDENDDADGVYFHDDDNSVAVNSACSNGFTGSDDVSRRRRSRRRRVSGAWGVQSRRLSNPEYTYVAFSNWMYIPFVKNDWSSMSVEDGIFACCLPWLSSSNDQAYQAEMKTLGLFCNVQVCGCMASTLFGTDGMSASSADVDSWAGECQGWASLEALQNWTAAQMATSLGSDWNWLSIIQSGGVLPGVTRTPGTVRHSTPITPGCFKNEYYSDGDIGAVITNINSAADCQAQCQATPACGVFVYSTTSKKCWRKCHVGKTCEGNSDGATGVGSASDSSVISGPKLCPLPPTPGCFKNEYYSDGDIGAVITNITSAVDCQAQCQANEACGVFQYSTTSKECWRKCPVQQSCEASSDGPTKAPVASDSSVISGPKLCMYSSPST